MPYDTEMYPYISLHAPSTPRYIPHRMAHHLTLAFSRKKRMKLGINLTTISKPSVSHTPGDSRRMDEEAYHPPGTVRLVDVQSNLAQAKHASGIRERDIVLVPAPSEDPDDPLNWSRGRKGLAVGCICVYTFTVGIASAAIYSVLEPIEQATGLTLGDLNAGTGYMFLFFGWGCLVFQPLALQYGKRPVYLLSVLATMAIMIWVPYTKTNGQWIASKILQGFFGAPVESLCEISVTDLYFTHERGSYIALYGFALLSSSYLAPVLAGFINDGQGWEWVLYWCAILCGLGFLFLLFCMEETNYSRKTMTVPDSDAEKQSSSLAAQTGNHNTNNNDNPDTRTVDADIDPPKIPHPKQPYRQKLKLFDRQLLDRPNRLRGMILRPLIFLTFPVIFYSGFSYGSNLVWFNVLNGTASLILSAKPYAFSSSMVGLSYISPLLGATLSMLYTGPLGDRFILYTARKNKGIMEPEHRLWLFTLSLILLPGGLLLWGVGAAHRVHWFGLVIAMGTLGFTSGLGLQLSLSYCIDSYRELSGEAVVTVILVRNTMSFAIGYGLTPWVTKLGLQNAFIVAAAAGLAQTLCFLVFVRYGRRLRSATEDRYRNYKAEMADAGLTE
ncbi:MAG: hypothetical protein Q9202_006132 [Teloschistes flavicans]